MTAAVAAWASLDDGETWRERAACAGMDPNMFVPLADIGRRHDLTAAKNVCATCPVVDDCRTFGLNNLHLQGVYGGLSQTERDPRARDRQRRNRDRHQRTRQQTS